MDWEVKNEYVELIEDFLNGILSADDFSILFMRMFEKIGAKVYQLKIDLKEKNSLHPSFQSSEISEFLGKKKACGIGYLLSRIYVDCDSFNPDLSLWTNIPLEKVQFRESLKNTLFEMQKYFDE